MAADDLTPPPSSFLGIGWSFPPRFVAAPSGAGATTLGQVAMSADETDIEESLRILFGTAAGERFLVPKYGLDMHELLFEPVTTTMLTFLEDRVKTAILIYEPRITLLSLRLDTSRALDGRLQIIVAYEVRSTNSRYNLVIPFSTSDANEVVRRTGLPAA